MSVAINIRPVISNDLDDLKIVVDANNLFSSDMLDDMMSDYFTSDKSEDIWLTSTVENRSVAIAYCAPEKMTEGTYNLYSIAVHPDYQGRGIGTAMVNRIEQMLSARGERILLVETSGLDSYKKTRSFYRRCGYEREARIREFYQAGEDKIVFWKSLM